ncbi:thiamin biosynthesis protein [Actinokineospora sp. NBRC 105648]|nr:thiamin biosynthesis protein [Actinokineospora sp. NBRC 105648]
MAVLHRRTGEIQVGLDPRRARVFAELPDQVVAAAAGLTGGRTTEELLAQVGPHGAAMVELLADLVGHGLVEDAGAVTPALPRRLVADDTAAAGRSPTAAPSDRAGLGVRIHGDGRLAVAIGCLLAEAGVGQVHVHARGEVAAEDVGAGLRRADIGRPRQEAAHDAITRAEDSVGTQRFTRRRPDLVLLTDAVVPRPDLVADVMAARLPHLCARVRDGVGIVGPFVVPGVSGCLRCADHQRTDLDPCWPLVAAQLAGRSQAADLATVHATAGVAAAQALDALGWLREPSKSPPSTWNTAVEIDAFAATLDRRPWSPHTACGCRAATRPDYRGLFGR